jgi:DNA-binding transcriptional LysR family regulator
MASPFPVPLNALRAIEIVARTNALGPAAEELGVTPGAVSQHVRRAEERLGVQLFSRTQEGLIPTAELVAVQPLLRTGFQALADASAALRAVEDNVLTITVGNVFASRWLVWRLSRFYEIAPDIELRILTTGKLVDLARPDIDCGIRLGTGDWPGVRTEILGGHTYMPVCSPDLAQKLKSPSDLAKVPIIQDPMGMLVWEDWFRGGGFAVPPGLKGPTFTDASVAFDAALAGQGVLLTVDMMAADGLALGRLVKPFAHQEPSPFSYWFATDAQKSRPKKVQMFLDWMRAEISATQR